MGVVWIDVDTVIGLLLVSKVEVETLHFEIIIRIEIDFQSKRSHDSRQTTVFCIDQAKTSFL